ncbi:MAG: sel1 repeat family protein [Ignavibacteriae bacterium]|nr:sel1 repeat family protein [Ignavibacteriota bacterium]
MLCYISATDKQYMVMSIRRGFPSLIIICASLLAIAAVSSQTKDPAKHPDSTKARSLVFKDPPPTEEIVMPGYDREASQLWDAFNCIRRANAGDAVAQHELGLRYLLGKELPIDTVKAASWIQKAALQKLVPATYNYGVLLNNGWGIAWNPFEAYRQFHYAALNDMKEAEYVFGLLLTDNLVVPRNYREAYRWLEKAESAGYEPAKEVIAEFHRRRLVPEDVDAHADSTAQRKSGHAGHSAKHQAATSSVDHRAAGDTTLPVVDNDLLERDARDQLKITSTNTSRESQEIEKRDSLSLQSLHAAAEAGSPEALILLGSWYEQGKFGTADEMTASVYYIRALRQESPWAPLLLEKLIMKEKYFERLKSRVAAGDLAAEFVLAGLAAYNFDHQITQEQALQFFKDAASQKYPPALVELGMCYYDGHWMEKDRAAAKRLFKEAAERGNDEANVRLAMLAIVDSNSVDKDSMVTTFQRAASRGSVLAQAMLGYCYKNGVGVPASESQALSYYRKAAARGSRAAHNALRTLYDEIRQKDPEFQIADENE